MQFTMIPLIALLAGQAFAVPSLQGALEALPLKGVTEALPLGEVHDPHAPMCRDGGKAHCCQATFTGSAAPVTLAADLLCYDLTPAVLNCVITEAPIDPVHGCVGEIACCQVNDLNPLLGLYCTKPPGDCVGREGKSSPEDDAYCTEVIKGRFGHCTDNDIRNNRLLEGLGL